MTAAIGYALLAAIAAQEAGGKAGTDSPGSREAGFGLRFLEVGMRAAELRALQATLPGRVRWDGQAAPLVRPGRRVAYVAEPTTEQPWHPLAERVVEALCSKS